MLPTHLFSVAKMRYGPTQAIERYKKIYSAAGMSPTKWGKGAYCNLIHFGAAQHLSVALTLSAGNASMDVTVDHILPTLLCTLLHPASLGSCKDF